MIWNSTQIATVIVGSAAYRVFGQLGPTATNIAGKAGMEMYKALGAEDNYVFHSNEDNGDHCRTAQKPNLKRHVQEMIDMHLLKKIPLSAVSMNSRETTAPAIWRIGSTGQPRRCSEKTIAGNDLRACCSKM